MAGSVVSYVVDRVGDFLVQEAVFLYEVRDQVDWVRRELGRMQCFLEDADAKRKRDERVSNWVREVRDAAYQAEDLVESFVLQAEIRRARRMGFTGYLRWCVCVPRQVITHHRFGEEIQRLKAKIGEISSSRSTYGIENLGAADGGERSYVDESVRERRRVALHADDSDVVGMGDEKENILERLFDVSVRRRAVISIVGMGGLGKTTLAKKVYNTVEIKSHFDWWAWINISQQYRVVELLQDMVKKVAGIADEELEKMKREELEEKLHTSLEGKKYLIVMDDVWGNDVWNTFRSHLPDVANGSRVLFTTRSIDVARAADPCAAPYELRLLNDEESWALFSKKVFPHQDVETVCSGQLQELGKHIAKKCGGLPLALVVLGGLLSRKERSITFWGKLADAIRWQHSEDGQLCLEILALSYNDLPNHLKWCFLYLGSFPEDFEIDVGRLTRLWIAEGFVKKKQGETLEESAEGYVEELIGRCMVQVVERSSYGSAETCRVHDLLHDLSSTEAREVGFFECHRNPDDAPSASSVRRLSFHKGMESYASQRHSTPSLRTLLGFNFGREPSMDLSVKGLNLLRVIDLEDAPVRRLPKEIGDVAHLRYLGLRKTMLTRLPASIGKLCHLQTLDVCGTHITKVPNTVWRMSSLRHVSVSAEVEPRIVDARILSNLNVLYRPCAGSWIDCLGSLTNLQKLGIEYISGSHHRALSSSLEKLSRLNTLSLIGALIPPCAMALSNLHDLHVLYLNGPLGKPPQPYSSDQLSPNLTQLWLRETRLDQDPLALLEKLPELRILNLFYGSYVGREMLCSRSGFPKLEILSMLGLPELEQWEIEDGAMRCLRRLEISNSRMLRMLPQGLQHVMDLQELTLRKMPDIFYSRVRKGEGEDWYKIEHIPSINIDGEQIN